MKVSLTIEIQHFLVQDFATLAALVESDDADEEKIEEALLTLISIYCDNFETDDEIKAFKKHLVQNVYLHRPL